MTPHDANRTHDMTRQDGDMTQQDYDMTTSGHLTVEEAARLLDVSVDGIREYRGSGGTRLCPVTLSVPRHITALRVLCDTSGRTYFCYASYVIQIARYRISAH